MIESSVIIGECRARWHEIFAFKSIN